MKRESVVKLAFLQIEWLTLRLLLSKESSLSVQLARFVEAPRRFLANLISDVSSVVCWSKRLSSRTATALRWCDLVRNQTRPLSFESWVLSCSRSTCKTTSKLSTRSRTPNASSWRCRDCAMLSSTCKRSCSTAPLRLTSNGSSRRISRSTYGAQSCAITFASMMLLRSSHTSNTTRTAISSCAKSFTTTATPKRARSVSRRSSMARFST
jgi:hypothetical protein